ncbi:hypothetical protein EPUL_006099, partial [Erysiphe pulchra]
MIKGTQPNLLRQAIQGTAFATLFYGSETWYGPKTSVWIINQLQGAINRAARAVLPVYKTTPVPVLLRETGWGPATAWLERSHDRLATRIAAADTNHPLRKRWKSPYFQWIRRRQFLELSLDTQEAPWYELNSTKAKEEIGIVGRTEGLGMFKEYINSSEIGILALIVFSDGSMDKDRNVGAGYCIYRGSNTEIASGKIPLERTVEIYDAEIIGATEGLRAPSVTASPIKIKHISASSFYFLANKADHTAGIIFPKNYDTPTKATYLHDLLEAFDHRRADELPQYSVDDHKIILEPNKDPPFSRKYRTLGTKELEAVKLYIEDLTSKGHIRPSSSPAAAPVLIVRKPGGGGLRVCIDYRGLNDITIKNRYPIPNIEETLQRLQGCKYFTKLDIIAAFNRIRIAAGDEWKTSFTTRYGQFEYLFMPFRICNAPGTFQHYINKSLNEYLDLWATAYLDDVLIFSKTLTEHKEHVRKVVSRLLDNKLFIDIHKCEFHTSKVKYLGLIVGASGIEMDPEKVTAVVNWKTPTTVKDVQAFLGFANFYRRFIHNFSVITKPLTDITRFSTIISTKSKKKQSYAPFHWSKECQSSFDMLKIAFTTAPILAHFDPNCETILETDASDFVTAGVLSQNIDGILRPISYYSKKMTPTECNYGIYDKELLAIVKAFEIWRSELISVEPDNPIKIYSDHKSLEWFMSTKILNRRQA